jgi:hypothetical protein
MSSGAACFMPYHFSHSARILDPEIGCQIDHAHPGIEKRRLAPWRCHSAWQRRQRRKLSRSAALGSTKLKATRPRKLGNMSATASCRHRHAM